MNKSMNVYKDETYVAQEVLNTIRSVFPNHKVIENGPARDVPVNDEMKALQTITIVDISSKEYSKGKQRKAIRNLRDMGLIRNL